MAKRLIDAEKLCVEILDGSYYDNADEDVFWEMVQDAPTVDAVEVVRCRDCKHWKHFDHLGCTDFVKVCGLANYMIGATGYCLYGERTCE